MTEPGPRATSPLPPQPDFFHAILRHLAGKPNGSPRENVHAAMPELLNLSEAQRTERLRNLPHLRYRHRSGWGLSTLKAAGYVHTPARGTWQITDRGRDLLASHPDGFDEDIGRRIIRASHKADREPGEANDAPAEASMSATQPTPDERIDAAVKEIHQTVAAELLDRIAQAPPVFFEDLVLDLLRALGYGASEDDLERVGGPGDGGFDGVISLDRLGFEKVYVQAKRWHGTVGRQDVQAFFGALSGRRARKGVFITTSSFTREAREFGRQIAESVVLIDGARLATLMIEHGVGVTHYRLLRLPRVDGDYFDPE
jgi:restriction system protein